MIIISEINKKNYELCFDFDSTTISLWSINQWKNELNKKGVKVFGLSLSNQVIGICSFQIIIDEIQINYFSVDKKFRRKGYGTSLMNHVIKQCELFKIKKLLLEVSDTNLAALKFYRKFKFSTVGIRKNYYKDGTDSLLKEKIFTNQ